MVKFRKLITKTGTVVLSGKDAETNEQLIAQVRKNEEVFHTKEAGSPFVNIKGKPKIGDIKEAAIFCARYSRDWKKNNKDVVIHRFKGKDVHKKSAMKVGTFGVKKVKVINVKKEDIKKFEEKSK